MRPGPALRSDVGVSGGGSQEAKGPLHSPHFPPFFLGMVVIDGEQANWFWKLTESTPCCWTHGQHSAHQLTRGVRGPFWGPHSGTDEMIPAYSFPPKEGGEGKATKRAVVH